MKPNIRQSIFRQFVSARTANAAVIFALASVPVVGMMGAAIDYSRANVAKARLQSALDATALWVSKSAPNMTQNELQIAAENHFYAIFQMPATDKVALKVAYAADKSTVTIDGATAIKSEIINIMGKPFEKIPVNGSSSVSWGSSRLRVALALDNTGSMASNNKMTALKTAAKNLVTQLQSAAQTNGDVYVSIVPFSRDVNVGKNNYLATWLDWQDHGSWDGWDSENGDDVNSTVCTKSGKKTKCKTSTTWVPDNHNTWNGCVADRDKDYDVKNSTPDPIKKATLFPADQYSECPVALMPLSYDWTSLKFKIDTMTPDGNTNITIGLAWAWQALTPGAPLFAPAEQSGYKYNKVIILLTDGENTENRFTNEEDAYLDSGQKAKNIDDRTKKACDNVKAAGITIYTVLVMDGNQTLLQNCASDPSKYFYLQSASGLVTAFNQIGVDLTNLRVSK